jgi:hypothetical protein
MSTWLDLIEAKSKRARRTFFSFHYQPDNQRAQVVKQSWLTKPDREAAGFFDSSAFETKKRTSDALKAFLNEQLYQRAVIADSGEYAVFEPNETRGILLENQMKKFAGIL